MANGQLDAVLRHIRKMVPDAVQDGTDQELLSRFATHHEEAVFEALMQRHGPMVLGVSQRVLSHQQDAEDVFQATFLVLARKAKSIHKRASLGSWLYGVAYRLALKLKASAARRRARERRVADMMAIKEGVRGQGSGVNQESGVSWSDLRPVLDEELSRLPEKYRAPIILCYLEGKTNVEAGRLLGWPAGSMSKRLARGRELLRSRLTQRGLALSTTALAAMLTENAQAAVPAALWQSSLKAAVMAGAGHALTGVVSTQVGSLVHGVMHAMFMTKMKIAAIAVLGLGLLAVTGTLVFQPSAIATSENAIQEAASAGAGAAAEGQSALALVPSNALGFAHINVHDLWSLDSMKNAREQLPKTEAFQELEKIVGLAVADIDTVTLIMLTGADPSHEPVVVTAITTSRPFTRDKLLGALVPEAQERQLQGKNVYLSGKTNFGVAVHLVSDRLFLVGDRHALQSYFDRLGWAPAESALTPALKLAEQKHAVVAGFQISDQMHDFMKKGRDTSGEVFQPLLDVQSGTLVADVNQEAKLKAQLHFAKESTAKEARNAAAVGIDMLKRYLASPASDALRNDELFMMVSKEILAALESAQVTQDKTTVQVTMESKTLPLFTMLPAAVQKTRVAAKRVQSQNNLKQIALAMHNYHDTYGRLPPQAITDQNGKLLLSWRVAILPFIEQDNLYKQFKLGEPWDSEHNKKLLEQMPKIYAPVNVKGAEKSKTYYQGFAGKGSVFEPGEKIRFLDIVDGTSTTILVVEAGDPVPWTKPEDLPFDPEKPLPKLGAEFPDIFNAAFCDGSVQEISKKIDDKTLRALITRNGGEPINFSDITPAGAAPPPTATPAKPLKRSVPKGSAP
jgi:RNA polymerase sigma factor (sigma-70 family)